MEPQFARIVFSALGTEMIHEGDLSMRTILITTAAVAAIASPAFAQVGLGGNVGGQIGGAASSTLGGVSQGVGGSVTGNVGARGRVGSPDIGAATDTVRQTGQSVREIGRDTVQDTREIGRSATDVQVGANANSQAGVNAGSGAASGYANLSTGMTLKTGSGETVGQIVDFTRNRAGQVTSVVVETADGARRTLPPASLSTNGEVAVTGYSGAQVRELPLAANTSGSVNGVARGRVGG